MRSFIYLAALPAFFIAPLALGASSTVGGGPPPPAPSPYLTNPLRFVADFYDFALAIGGLLAFGAIVYGAVKYTVAAGNPSGQSDAKDQMTQALLGLVLLLSAFMILRFVNPDILTLRLPTLEPMEGIETVDNVPFTCAPVTAGPASLAALQGSCFGTNAEKASGIARRESGGDPSRPSSVDKCQPGGEPVSWGLFQINISANPIGGLNCPLAFDRVYTGSNHQCRITNQALYNQCVAAAKDPAQNIRAACAISRNGMNWGPWGANLVCHF